MDTKKLSILVILLIVLVEVCGVFFFTMNDNSPKLNFTTPTGYKVINSTDKTIKISDSKTIIKVDRLKTNETVKDLVDDFNKKHANNYTIENYSSNYNNISIEGVIVSNATDNDTDDDMNTVDNNTSNAYHFWYSKDNNTYHIFVKGKMNETFKESTIESIVNSTKILN